MLGLLRKVFPERSWARLTYHKVSAVVSALWFLLPARKLTVIAVTGTSGKSTTVELIHSLLQAGGKKAGALSTIQFHVGDTILPNHSLRTTLRPWQTQKLLRRMVSVGCTHVVLEVSSHALDQHRTWGIPVDTAVLTNISDNEHLDYHGTFADYVQSKEKLFHSLNLSFRKPHIPKQIILNADDDQYERFAEIPADQHWTFARQGRGDFRPTDVKLSARDMQFTLRVPNHQERVRVPLVGEHNLENLLAAVAAARSAGIDFEALSSTLPSLPGIPGRLETISRGQAFSAVVDFSYKPSALRSVIAALKPLTEGRLIVVWGGAGGRAPSNWSACAQILDAEANEIVLTTDDPGETDPKKIAAHIRQKISREEGTGFFEIEDRYEAIRYALYTAEAGDTVLIAGRGHEGIQKIGKKKIRFDDRDVVREILAFAEAQDLLEKSGLRGHFCAKFGSHFFFFFPCLTIFRPRSKNHSNTCRCNSGNSKPVGQALPWSKKFQ
ncbi:MAG: UDP-N-acetylmuramoyl-L-alanyl-D-glutamate--2,6-diaminopimelate ligase [Candidatus Gracilibacteria bacterium]|nr:UDP-N-acetylmuramoyl-L-alanyl-D-glutamate--2,6-diaminopimelate ligase [Candidatus Gracilibacteria bacterium]